MDNIQPGQTLGAYRILNQIGQGGMATVYKAYHAAMDRYVAIKVLPRQLAESPEFTGRFQQEARIIANLEHPHILPVHDYGETDGVTYLIMRYMDAGTLKDRMKSGPLALAEIDRLFSQLADALDYAHSKGVIHRDLKPANVLVDARGSVFLTDFGIAKLLESSSQFTGTGAMVGTPAYMSPEQAQGFKVDQRTDIYALGIILYEMVTGRVPYEAETPLAVILKHLNDPLPLPTQVKADLSPAIERVLLKALAKAPDDRYESVAGFLAAWKHALTETDTVRAQPAPVITPSPLDRVVSPTSAAPTVSAPAEAKPTPPKAKTPVWVLVLAGLGALLVCCVGLFFVTAPGRRVNNQRATQTALHATQTARAQAAAPTATADSSVVAEQFSTATPTASTSVAAPPSGWTSWTGANLLNGLTVYNDLVIAWGAGGVTIWNRADGTLKQHIAASILLEPYVNTVLMDPISGALWIGGDGGVTTNDSGDWRTYNANNGLDSWQVGALGWAKDPGGLIIGTLYSGAEGGGLLLYDGQTVKPVKGFPSANSDEHPELLSYNVQALLVDYENNVWWVGTGNGLGRYDVAQKSWTTFIAEVGLPSTNIESLLLDHTGTLWVGTQAGLARFNGETFEQISAADSSGPNYDVTGLVEDNNGNGWISGGGGVWRYDGASGELEYFDPGQHPELTWNMSGAAKDADGNLYFGAYGGGVVKYADQQFEPGWQITNTIGMKGVSHILPAPDGQIWFVEEYGSQTDAIDPGTDTWSLVPLDCDYCTPLAFDAEGNLWLGGEAGVWIRYADGRETLHLTTANSFLPDDRVYSIAFGADGYVAVGTAGGVAAMNDAGVTGVFNSATHGLASDNVHAVLIAEDGALWVATDGGVSRMRPDGAWTHYHAGDPFSNDVEFVADLAEDASGAIWVATSNNGAWRFADGKWKQFETDSLISVAAAPDGTVWFGTYYSDALHFDGKNWTTLGAADGLVQSNVNDVYVDASGAVWFATSGGVSRYRP